MAEASVKPIRRVVTGNDERGRSRVVWDGPAPDVHIGEKGANSWTDLWVWNDTPPPLSGSTDDGNLPYDLLILIRTSFTVGEV